MLKASLCSLKLFGAKLFLSVVLFESRLSWFGESKWEKLFSRDNMFVKLIRSEVKMIIKKFLASRYPRPPNAPKEIVFGGSPDFHVALPSWLSEEDVNYYASKFEQKGFTGGLNYYCAMDLLMGKVASDKCHKWVFKEPTECEPNISNYWQSSC
ncbi:hypothetical protein ACSQ67_008634 [Phaseolus vulgaris]